MQWRTARRPGSPTVMAVTTDVPWCPRPRLSVLGLTLQAKWQPTTCNDQAKHHRLGHGNDHIDSGTASLAAHAHESRTAKYRASGRPPSCRRPQRHASVVHTLISGMATASASARGNTRRKPCAMPMTRMASSSSVTRITPICAVMAEPERPAISTAASTGRARGSGHCPRMSTIKVSAPKVMRAAAT